MNKNSERLAVKVAYLKELLKSNPFAPTDDLNKAIGKKFAKAGDKRAGGVARSVIQDVRLSEYGIRIGPAGRYFNRKGEMVEVPPQFEGKPVSAQPVTPTPPTQQAAPNTNAEERQKRLAEIIGRLRAEMTAQGIQQATIPLSGPVATVQHVTVQRELKV